MAITDYGELSTAITTRAVRADLGGLNPDFIRRAHDIIVTSVTISADLTIDAEDTTLPDDFRQLVSLAIVGRTTGSLTPGNATVMDGLGSGCPYYYRIEDLTLYVAPTPTISYPAKIAYRLSRATFADETDTNTILTRYPFVYLYGAMAELFAHTRDSEEQAKYEALFRSEIDRINEVERDDAWPGALQSNTNVVV
jgi:hypothetical protein